ncbi:MAG: zf-HC2 domain-containing protein [Bryobacterales bacterium]|nr:zf-HC2 domain-containing protein [Bryobacterales bacterium]
MLTCKQFLDELSDYLDETTASEVRESLERHLSECPNCWVICDTTRKTIQIYRGMDPVPVPDAVHTRLMAALEKKKQAARAKR